MHRHINTHSMNSMILQWGAYTNYVLSLFHFTDSCFLFTKLFLISHCHLNLFLFPDWYTCVSWPFKNSKTYIILPANWATKCFMYLASNHRCSYPGCPHRWRCWSRVQSDTVVVASHSFCQWRLCESSHSCSWDNQGFRNDINEINYKFSLQSVFTGVKFESIRNTLQNNFAFQNLARATISSSQPLELGYLLIHPIYTQSPILAWLLLALVNVDFALVSLETGQAGASEATGVVTATAAIETGLWLTLINLDLTSGPCEHQSSKDVRQASEPATQTEGKGQTWTKLLLAMIMFRRLFYLTARLQQILPILTTIYCIHNMSYKCIPAL